MPNNLRLQLKFLNDLDVALDTAMVKHRFDEEKMGELRYMHCEVLRAREVVLKRIRSDLAESKKPHTKHAVHSEKNKYPERIAV